MDLGLSGKKAIVCASSQGLGFACATALAEEGAHVWINGRTAEKLAQSAEDIRNSTGNPNVFTAVGDLTIESQANLDAGTAARCSAGR